MNILARLVQQSHAVLNSRAFRQQPAAFISRSVAWILANLMGSKHKTALSYRYGFVMNLPVGWQTIGSTGFFIFRDHYDPVWEHLDKLLRPGDIFIDGGASLGIFSLAASRIVGEQGRVIAVEPQDYAVKYLKDNIERNQAANVTIVQAALYDSITTVKIASVGRVYAAIDWQKITKGDRGEEMDVATTTVDEL